ncbi:telomere repeats-binding bouquet formation protein 1-like [Anomaloglossus baeobatrachus]|uniref:telomere repeats-binding bouquet formation protein 1-like n=1 Tax=Anomaloglossus baeobatrachus TaxID=238106 RepID=UPI003F5012F9
MVWLQQLEDQITEEALRDQILANIPCAKGSAAFLADASTDILRLSAKMKEFGKGKQPASKEGWRDNKKKRSGFLFRSPTDKMKSELSVLMERLKVQMDDPESQNETLVAVRSICQENSDLCKYFVDMGGLRLLYNLAISSSHSWVKEASLYTLAVLARSNVYCQQILSTAEFFGYICTILSDEGSSVNLKQISVFLILVLVSNNKTGQSLARESGCIETLLLLFSKILPSNVVLVSGSTNPEYQLWSSVCSALGACAAKQNEENQNLCRSAIPQAMEWLYDSLQHEIVRPICCMIRPIVANNSKFAQDHFAAFGGLETLADILSHLLNGLQERSLDFRLAMMVMETLDTCITGNSESIRHLEYHNIILSLMSLLSCGNLEAKYKLSIVRTIGHLTEDCAANQHRLLKSHGLSLMDQILAESQDDKLQKAARFVRQNCRPIKMKSELSVLMERLEVQMDDPEFQNETLVAVRSICQENSDACKYFVDSGGLRLLYNLVESSSHSWVKEASLFTLAVLARSNVYCQQILSTAEYFREICTILSDEGSSVNLKQMCISMILLLVSNNRFAQDYFASIGGLEILADILSHLVNGLEERSLDFRLAILVMETLDTCITGNSESIRHLENHNIISSLMSLLSCGNLGAKYKFRIVLTIGHLTKNCEANQYKLLKSHGLSLMDQILAESQDDKLQKAARYVLQNCRHIKYRKSTKKSTAE